MVATLVYEQLQKRRTKQKDESFYVFWNNTCWHNDFRNGSCFQALYSEDTFGEHNTQTIELRSNEPLKNTATQ